MNEDYLWDKSGDPDPQIQELEDILGRLRYQRRPLKLDGLSLARRRNYGVLLAIAASVAIAVVAGGLWLRTRSTEPSIPAVAYVTPAPPHAQVTPVMPVAAVDGSPSRRPPAKRQPALTAKVHTPEAVAAKQQLMFALRLASAKLNDAYRRTQTPSQIKNQHRAG